MPNLLQICWKMVATDDAGSKLRRPVFVLSDRFVENYGVSPALEPEAERALVGRGEPLMAELLLRSHMGPFNKDLPETDPAPPRPDNFKFTTK